MFEPKGIGGADVDKSALEELTATAAEIGVDPLLVQGAGGNASVKIEDALAKAVAEALALHGPADVLLLQNHGVVVGAERPRAAADLLREVERRLMLPVRSLPKPDITAACA